jgi:ribose 5-phosphate isomerase B
VQFQRFFIGADHAGFELKKHLVSATTKDFHWVDVGTWSPESVDYPDYAARLIKNLISPLDCGLLICGSGQGMAIKANRASHVRAALCFSVEMAQLAREHNNANVLCLGARFVDANSAVQILKKFVETPFLEGRHAQRVAKLSE